MTTATETPAGGALNGAVPGAAPPPDNGEGRATAGETLMGLLGIAFAVGLLAIGLDLVTGGAVSRLFGATEPSGDSAGG